MYGFLLAIKLYSSVSTLAAEFDAHNTKTKKENSQPDLTEITLAQKVEHTFLFCFQHFIHGYIHVLKYAVQF